VRVIRELAQLLRLPGFRRLFAVRLTSQTGDGLFEVGLASLFFFSPQNQSTAGKVAVAFAVLLLPFTIVGPWAGVFLDRWRRRQVLLYGNVVRILLAVAIAVLMMTSGITPAVYVLALVSLSVNRFLLSALSAALPRVVDGPLLLTANSLTPTLGAAVYGLGAAIGFGLALALPQGKVSDTAAVVVGALVFAAAAALAGRIGRDELGPDRGEVSIPLRRQLQALTAELSSGARYLIRRRTPAYALAAMAAHRFLYGIALIASILISSNLLADPHDAGAGLRVFAMVLAASAVGFSLAVVLTPVLAPLTGQHAWIAGCLVLAAASQLLLAATIARTALLICAAALGLAAQGAKIAVDTIVQRDTADGYRGRAFSLYDVLYNASFVGAAALAAVALPDDGYSPALFVAVAVAYLAAAVIYRGATFRTPVAVPVAPSLSAVAWPTTEEGRPGLPPR
jgi:MFS family permease